MASDLMPAHPTFKHKRNLIVLPSLLLHDLDIYGMKKGTWQWRQVQRKNKTEHELPPSK